MALGAIISAGAGLTASLGGSLLSGKMGRDEAIKSRRFIKKMSDTSYQRAMADMRKAGLNPILAYQRGGAGGAPNVQPQVPDMGKAISSGLQASRLQQELKNLKQTQHKDEALTDQADSQISLNEALEQKAREEATVAGFSAKGQAIDNILQTTRVPGAQAQESLDKTPMGRALRMINRTTRSLFGNDPTSAR